MGAGQVHRLFGIKPYLDPSRPPAAKSPLRTRPAAEEMEDQHNNGDDQKQVNERAADVAEQAEKPEDGNDDGYPKQHENLPNSLFAD